MKQIGDRVGEKYTLLGLLGEGGMGRVFEARNQHTGRRVALKMLQAEHAQNPHALERFLREARAATSISHPNVVDVLDLDVDRPSGEPYIVQEFLVGESLASWLASLPGRRVRVSEALPIFLPVLSAMAEAHRKRVVHRDLKPENIFLARGPDGEVIPKVIDFGIVRLLESLPGLPSRTGQGAVVGTPAYMSPEQVAGVDDIDERTDVWSLGVVLYQMLCGRLPYEAATSNLLLAKILYEPPTPLAERDPTLPPAVVSVVERALVRDRAQRTPSVEALREALLACPRAPESAVPVATLTSAPRTSSHSDRAFAPTLVDPSPYGAAPRVSRRSMAALAAVLLACVGVVAWSQRAQARAPTVTAVVVNEPRPVAAPDAGSRAVLSVDAAVPAVAAPPPSPVVAAPTVAARPRNPRSEVRPRRDGGVAPPRQEPMFDGRYPQ